MNEYVKAYKRFSNIDYDYETMDELYKDLKLMKILVKKSVAYKPIFNTPKNVERPYCSKCGLRLKKTWIVCPRCETKIDWGKEDNK